MRSDGGKTSVDLTVDTAVTLEDLEGSLISPSVIPGVDGEPVVFTTFGSVADELDSMATKSTSSLMGVDSTLVGKEVLVDGEGSGNSSVGDNVCLDGIDPSDSIGGGRVVLVAGVVNGRVGLAC